MKACLCDKHSPAAHVDNTTFACLGRALDGQQHCGCNRRGDRSDPELEVACLVAALDLCLSGGNAGESLRDKVQKCIAVAERGKRW